MLRHVGLYEERYRPIGGYSTGMRQRVQLAQAIVHDPRLLLLDEPTNGLDPAGRDEMLELIRRTGHEFRIAIILASHLLGEIEEVCDYLVAIDAGRLLRRRAAGRVHHRDGALTVEVEEGRDALVARLGERGLRLLTGPATVRPAGSGSPSRTRSRTTRSETRSPISACRSSGSSGPAHLEDLFRAPDEDVDEALRPAHRRGQPAPGRDAMTGNIYDLGYRGYDGPRLGRRHAIATLIRHSMRSVLGLGRTTRAKIMPLICIGLPASSRWSSSGSGRSRRAAGSRTSRSSPATTRCTRSLRSSRSCSSPPRHRSCSVATSVTAS